MQRARGVKQREGWRPTPTQKTRSEPPPTFRHDRKEHSSDKMHLQQPSCTTGTAQCRKKSMLLRNPQHFTLQGTQRMDFMRQGNGGAVHIDRRPNVRFGSKADILGGLDDVRFTPNSGHQNWLGSHSA